LEDTMRHLSVITNLFN